MILDVTDLRKTYSRGGRRVAALDGMTMSVAQGGVHGLVGPNGAGKSTLLRIVLGLVRADGGVCRIFGGPAGNAAARRNAGSMIETPRLYPFLTGEKTLRVMARMSGHDLREVPALLNRVGLAQAARRKVATYSVGMKQRLTLAAALLGRPQFLILDEPLNGLDPAGIREMRELIGELAQDGATILMSSHVLSEVERVCDRVTIINKGRAVAEGAVADLLSGARMLRIEAEPLDAALGVAGADGEISGGALWASVTRQQAPKLLAALTQAGVQVFEARWTGQDLESLFFAATETEGGVDGR